MGISSTEAPSEHVSLMQDHINKSYNSLVDISPQPVAVGEKQTQLHLESPLIQQHDESCQLQIVQENIKPKLTGNTTSQTTLEDTEIFGEQKHVSASIANISQESYSSGSAFDPLLMENVDNVFTESITSKKPKAIHQLKNMEEAYSLNVNVPLENLRNNSVNYSMDLQGAEHVIEPENFVIGLNTQNLVEDSMQNISRNDIYEYANVTLTAPERKRHSKLAVNQYFNKSLEEEIDDDDLTVSVDKSIEDTLTKNASISFQLQHGMDVDFTVFLGDTSETGDTEQGSAVETTFKLQSVIPVIKAPDVSSSFKHTTSTNDFNIRIKRSNKCLNATDQENYYIIYKTSSYS